MLKKTFIMAALIALPFNVALASSVPDGKAIYAAKCASCHGVDGSVSKLGKSLKPFPARNHRAIADVVSRDEMRRIITYGVRGTAMNAKKYDLDPLEIEAVIDHIQSFDYKPNLANGKKRFKQVCASCHGIDGRAQTGLGAKNLIYSKLNLEETVHVIRNGRLGTLMTPKKHQLSNPDISDVAHYTYSLRYQADANKGAKLFANNCKSCHESVKRIKLIGNAATKMTVARLSTQMLDLRIRHGRHVERAGKSVTALSADDIQDIIAYIRK